MQFGVGLFKCLRDDTRLGQGGHEIGVARPTRDDVLVDVVS